MAVRLLAMRRPLKPTGSIYLHCDPTASHYLKMVMDVIFGKRNFRNEIVWCYSGGGQPKMDFPRKHDTIFRYSKGTAYVFNKDRMRVPYDSDYEATVFASEESRAPGVTYTPHPDGKVVEDWWRNIPRAYGKERLGYPTQKPVALLERIIKASSPPDGLVLDPFCGCGTAVHAAEKLGRRWIGIDVSAFATGLVRQRILRNFKTLTTDDVLVRGVPVSVPDAEALAKRDKFEFEKWVCGAIGAEGMFHEPGSKGADGGVDGVLKFWPIRFGRGEKLKPVQPEYAIIQVKGGNVTPDAVKALKATVDNYGAKAGVMVCFNRFMRTVENQRSKAIFKDDMGSYPVIQGFSVENLLGGELLQLPTYRYQRYAKESAGQIELGFTG